jgi:hypothetical protein
MGQVVSGNCNNNKHPECDGVNCTCNCHKSEPAFENASMPNIDSENDIKNLT